MALPVANLVRDAIEDLYAAFTNDKTLPGMRVAVQALNELQFRLNTLYPVIDIIITGDADDAGVSEFIAAESTMVIGVVLRKLGDTAADDLTDNAFATAKTARTAGALATGDLFVIDGADSVEYLRNSPAVDGKFQTFGYEGESTADFG